MLGAPEGRKDQALGAQAPKISEAALSDFVQLLFMARGMSAENASKIASVLVWADMRGSDTHGVSRIPHYFGMIDKGAMKPVAVPRLQADFGALFSIDAQGAAGPIAMMQLLDGAQDRARQFGVGFGVMSRATHAGAIGYYADQAARNGFAAIAFAAGPPLMAYEGARIASASTAPLAMAVPGGPEGVVLLDMAASQISNGRLKQARRNKETLPVGWALDADGQPATDAAKAETLLPLGGPKGSGFALLNEVFTSVLAGAPLLSPMLAQGKKGHGQSATMIIVDIARLREPADFASDMGALSDAIKALPRVEGVEELRLPGERGARALKQSRAQGIKIDAKVWDELVQVAQAYHVALPEMGETK
jgi:ureidoglycolate dehydrogenase (NAD+)